MKKWTLFLAVYFCVCLLAACAAGGGEPDEYMCFFASAETDCVLRAEAFYYDRAGAAELESRGGEEGATDALLRSCAMAAGTLELAVNP